MNWEPPRCQHGRIILGCPFDDCEKQNDYLAAQRAALDQYEAEQREAARAIVRAILNAD